MTELIKVSQLPVIEEHLRSVRGLVEQKVNEAKSIACTKETLASVKQARTDLRKMKELLNSQRIAVKKQIMEPYLDFENVFKECANTPLDDGINYLSNLIKETEEGIKSPCEEELRGYFKEICEAEGVQWLTYDRAGIFVDMTSAKQKTPKKLREQITQFVTGVSHSVSLIADMDNADEIMVEFKRTLDAAEAISIVQDRHRRLAAERAYLSTQMAIQEVREESVRTVEEAKDSFAPPKIVGVEQGEDPKDVFYVSFKVTGTLEQLKELKKFLIDGGYQYEQF